MLGVCGLCGGAPGPLACDVAVENILLGGGEAERVGGGPKALACFAGIEAVVARILAVGRREAGTGLGVKRLYHE